MNELVKFNQVEADMAAFKEENENLIFDYEDPQGNKDARSHIFKLRKIKTLIADIHKEAKAQALGVCKLLDKKKRDLTGQVDEWIDVHYKPVKVIEDRAAKEAAEKANAERLEAIRIEAERTAERERREEELAAKELAMQEKEAALAREQEKLEAAKQAEIDKVNAVMRAQEQAERDKIETAAKVEQLTKDVAKRAEHDRQVAVEAEKERQRKKAEAEQVEKDRLAELETERVADIQHRTDIEAEIALAVTEIQSMAEELGQDIGEALLTALIDNEIAHVTITY